MRLAVVVWAALILLSGQGCSQKTEPSPFELTLELLKVDIRKDERPFVRVSLKNVSTEGRYIEDSSFFDGGILQFRDSNDHAGLFIEVTEPDGSTAPAQWEQFWECRTPQHSPMAEQDIRLSLAPGETLVTRYWALQDGCETIVPPRPELKGFVELAFVGELPPGSYKVRAIYDTTPHEGGARGLVDFWEGTVSSDPSTFVVRP